MTVTHPLGRLALGGALVVCSALLAALVPPFDDELYYWCWAQKLQLSYFDHPPMVAYLIRLSCGMFGDSVWAVRLPACAAGAAVWLIISESTPCRRLLPWVLCTPLFTFGSILMTPDTPLILAWALYFRWLVAVHRRLTPDGGWYGRVAPAWWLLGGIILGFGALGKYTMALAVPAGFVSFRLSGTPWKAWLPGYLGHGVVSLACFAPVIAYNVPRDFEPLLFQWAHAMSGATGAHKPGWLTGVEFLAMQVALFGTFPLVLFPWAVARAKQLSADPLTRVSLALYAVPFGFFALKSFRGPLEGNWALVSYLSFWPLAQVWLDGACPARWRGWSVRLGFAAPACIVAVIAVHLVTPWPWYAPKRDRITRQFGRFDLAGEVAGDWRRAGGGPVYTPTYQWVALLRFRGVDARQMAGVSRPSHFTVPPESLADCDTPLVFNEIALIPELCRGFGPPEELGVYPLAVRGEPFSEYRLMRYRKCPDGAKLGAAP